LTGYIKKAIIVIFIQKGKPGPLDRVRAKRLCSVWFDMEYWSIGVLEHPGRRLFLPKEELFCTLHNLCSRFFISTSTLQYSNTPRANEVAVNLSPLG